ncbi:response regulator [Acidipila rosea]|uniref:Two-component system chemotaxis response regulator CheY n=1 Tax=Acidipila rosea TaxID=768535 RepID=A0A4R1KZ07_9BACT|nr:response regulator [Acidipila rosea]MBW4027783.1 response regulator [Acidobacteriota bacterium]MBW4045487.1 response regulator [Acidobacteriota bacterium]TCK70792.1 two-component system chemotaxis response regulator CheY [Acidipila rosea]
MRALIVDDSRFIRDYLASLLEEQGIECTGTINGQEGLDCMRRSGPYDLALVDWNMPIMGGLDFVRAVRADHGYDTMKIVMVTTEADNQFLEAALDAGANEYLMKPFDEMGLMDKLEMIGAIGD